MAKELQELRTKAAAAPPVIDELLAALREASFAVESVAMLVGELQREAKDCEFEPIPAAVDAHLDGSLLQRTRYCLSRATEAGARVRDLASGLRNLRRDCETLLALVPEEPAV